MSDSLTADGKEILQKEGTTRFYQVFSPYEWPSIALLCIFFVYLDYTKFMELEEERRQQIESKPTDLPLPS